MGCLGLGNMLSLLTRGKMPVPDFQSLMLPVLKGVAAKAPVPAPDLRIYVAEQLELTDGDLAELLPSGRQTTFANRTAWANIFLQRAGLIKVVRRGVYELTPAGATVLEQQPAHIDMKFLERFPSYTEWRKRSMQPNGSDEAQGTESDASTSSIQNIKDGVFSDERAHISPDHFTSLSKHRVFPGDLVIAALGEKLPRACILPDSLGPAIVKADCVRFKPHEEVSSLYLNAALNAPPTRSRALNTIHGVGRPRLNLDEIRSLRLPLPPREEQVVIAARVAVVLNACEQLRLEIAVRLKHATKLRQAILKNAFQGRLVPQERNDEPSSAVIARNDTQHRLALKLSKSSFPKLKNAQ